jgi:hypothetical protein
MPAPYYLLETANGSLVAITSECRPTGAGRLPPTGPDLRTGAFDPKETSRAAE